MEAVPTCLIENLQLFNYGWASFSLTAGGQRVEIGEFGYCTDAFGDLLRAALMIAAGGAGAEIGLDGEGGGEWRLVLDEGYFSRESPRTLRLRVLTFTSFSWQPSSEGEVKLQARVGADDFAHAVLAAFKNALGSRGAQDYCELWSDEYRFPARALAALECALSLEDPPVSKWHPCLLKTGCKRD